MNIDQIKSNCLEANRDYFENSVLVDVNGMGKYFSPFSLADDKFEVTGPVIANYVENGARKNYCLPHPCHTIIIGGTGSGKTECYFSAQAEAFAKSVNKPSVFFMDLKGDYYRNFSGLYKAMGYKVFVLNLKQPFMSCRYNPLTPVWLCYRRSVSAKALLKNPTGNERTFLDKTYESFAQWKDAVNCYAMEEMEECQNYLRRITNMIIPLESEKDPTWEMGAREMFYNQAIGLLEDSAYPERRMSREKFTIANIIRIANCTEDDCDYIYDWIRARDKKSVVRGLMNYYTEHAKVTRDGYISTFTSRVDKWKGYAIEWLTSDSDIDVEKIVARLNYDKVAIFCITDETRPETYDLCMALMDHLISAIKIYNDKVEPMRRDFHILADEFANMPPLSNMQNRITTLRSYRVWLHMGIQSYDQLDDKYNANVRNIILDNCDCQVFFGTNNSKTSSEFASSLGERIAPVSGHVIGNDGKLSINISAADRPLIRRSDLAALQLGEAYVKVFRNPTAFTLLQPHFKCADLYHGDAEPEREEANLAKLEASVYDIRLLGLRTRTRFGD